MENDTPNKIKISKEIIATLPIETFPGKIVVIDNERDADNAVLQLNNESIIGFDTETRPTFKKGKSNHPIIDPRYVLSVSYKSHRIYTCD
mgnify:CR=1 FL=1